MGGLTMEGEVFTSEVRDLRKLAEMPEEYRQAVAKIVVSHAVNEIAGAEAFDEPAIRVAPTPYHKWLACRIAMEEYGHHVHFSRLAIQLGVPEQSLDHRKKHLSVFELPISTWTEFVVMKAIGDLAEVIMVEELEHCSFLPLRDLAIKTMPEEKFHAGFGRDQMIELVKTPKGREGVQRAVDYIFPVMLPFFGGSNSRNNALFRRWGIKRRTNDEMRADYVQRVKKLVEGEFGLTVPQASI
jgi:ring-1,2-phenylacetyl-CoA epoxidase subunit PaaA